MSLSEKSFAGFAPDETLRKSEAFDLLTDLVYSDSGHILISGMEDTGIAKRSHARGRFNKFTTRNIHGVPLRFAGKARAMRCANDAGHID